MTVSPTDSAEKVVADLAITPDELRLIAEYACWDKFEDRYISDPKRHPAWKAAALIESQRATIESQADEMVELRRSVSDYATQCGKQRGRAEAAEARVTALGAEMAGLVKAVTPSPKTKAAYIGEFHFDWTVWPPDGEGQITHRVQVPWTTIKQIMSAIHAQALSRSSTEAGDADI